MLAQISWLWALKSEELSEVRGVRLGHLVDEQLRGDWEYTSAQGTAEQNTAARRLGVRCLGRTLLA